MALIHRTKILLSVLQELGGHLTDTRMQQLLFLYCKEFVKRDEYYEFIPLSGSPYSVQAEEDTIFYTIGYEGISPEAYINLLIQNGVQLLVDVRKNAFSQKYGFSKSELASILPRVGVEYLHMPELGIESEKRQRLVTDSDYEELFKEYDQTTIKRGQTKLDQLQRLLEEKQRIAITCFEADPYHCHRSRVAKALKAREQFTYKIEHLQSCKHSNHLKQNERKSS